MLEDRKRRVDLAGLILLGVTAFLALALLTYNPADPPGTAVFPTSTSATNACGRFGALVAHWLFTAVGLGAYYVVLSLGALDAALVYRKRVDEAALRIVGWAMSLVGVSTFAALAVPQWSPGPVIGAGGYLGAAGRGLLEMNFATAGSYILVLCVTFVGLLLSTDYLLVRLSAWLLAKPTRSVAGGLVRSTRAVGSRLSTRGLRLAAADDNDEDEDDEDGDEEIDEEYAIRIAGKIDASEDEEEDEDAVAPGAASAAAKTSAAAGADASAAADAAGELRIKVPTKVDPRKAVMAELDAAANRTEDTGDYELPPVDLLLESEPVSFDEHKKEVRRQAKILEKTFANFGYNVKVVEIETGPVISQFEVELEAGLRLSKITGLADDVAIALRVPSVRIVAPIPGKNTVGIEVPNAERQMVRIREVIEESAAKSAKMKIPIFLGKDVSGNPLLVDLSSLPHLLIAGRTGTGKSVCLNSIIVSMLMTRRPDEVRMLLIDPKMVELSAYKTLPHLMHPVVTDMRKAEAILAWAVEKMEERYALLARAGVRHISGYNTLGEEELMDRLQPESDEERKNIPTHLPYIVIVADEMADLMMTSAKEVETHIIRLAQKSRAVGIHLVLATQKPTVDVITGLIKSNLPARIAFQVASRTDSRVVLDEMGADKLLGNGDMLFLWPGTSTLLRGQGTYVSDEEINKITETIGTAEPQFVKELVQLRPASKEGDDAQRFKSRDELYEAAIDLIVREGRGSVSLLQRALGVGYGRGARLIDYMAEDGIVGPYNGSQAREVLITVEQWEEMRGGTGESAPPIAPVAATPPKPRQTNRIRPELDAIEEQDPPFDIDDADQRGNFDDESRDDAEEKDDEREDEDEHDVEPADEIDDEADELDDEPRVTKAAPPRGIGSPHVVRGREAAVRQADGRTSPKRK